MAKRNGETRQAQAVAASCCENPTPGCDEQRAASPIIVDHRVTLLIAAGAAMAANCERCLNKVVPDLIEAGVTAADIRAAVEIGQFVKDRPAAMMKEAADVLAGTQLSDGTQTVGCPAESMNQAASWGA
jgi:hypothetical protein